MALVTNRSAIILASLITASLAAGAAAYLTGITTTLTAQLTTGTSGQTPQTLIYSILTIFLLTEIVFVTAFGLSRYWLGRVLRGEASFANGLTDTAITFIGVNTFFLLASSLLLTV
mgnify:CR=1 FL=1